MTKKDIYNVARFMAIEEIFTKKGICSDNEFTKLVNDKEKSLERVSDMFDELNKLFGTKIKEES